MIDAIRKRPKDFAPEIAAEPEGDERLAESVSQVIGPAIVDAIASRPDDFTSDLSSGAPGGSGNGAGDDKFPWGAWCGSWHRPCPASSPRPPRARAAASDLTADPAAGEQKVMGAIAAAVAGAAAWHAIAAWRGKDLGPGFAGDLDDGSGGGGRIGRGAARVATEVVPAVVRELTGQNQLSGQKMILPAGMQLPHTLPMPGRYVIM